MASARPLDAAATDPRLHVDREPFALTGVGHDVRRRVQLGREFGFVRHVLSEEHIVCTRAPFPTNALSEYPSDCVRATLQQLRTYMPRNCTTMKSQSLQRKLAQTLNQTLESETSESWLFRFVATYVWEQKAVLTPRLAPWPSSST